MPRVQAKREEWIRADTWKVTDNRRTPKKKLIDAMSERLCERYQQQYSDADRRVKRLTRADTRAYIDGLAAEAENAAKCNQQVTVCNITKPICGQCQAHANTIIKDEQGSLLTTERERERARGTLDGTFQRDSEQTTA